MKITTLQDKGNALYGKLGVVLHPVIGVTNKKHELTLYFPFRATNFGNELKTRLRHMLGEIDDAKLDEMLLELRLPDAADLQEELDRAVDSEQLAEFERRHLGPDSAVAGEKRKLGQMPSEHRREAGRRINEVSRDLQERVSARRAEIETQEQAGRIASEGIDVTLDHQTG